MTSARKHLIIPDTQVKPGILTDHLRWIGLYIAEKQPDVVIHLGDHWDMPSLSSYDRGKKSFEGRRYSDDVESGNEALRLLTDPIDELNRGKRANKRYNPRLVLLRGNHEDRIARALEYDPTLEGTIGLDDLESDGWEVINFKVPIWIDGIAYCHYFYNPLSGRPYGGQVATRLKTIGCSFTMGHQQVFDYAMRPVAGSRMHQGLVAGSCYLHDEDYLGPQGNTQWRGIIVKHEVRDGMYDIMAVSLAYLCRRYEGKTLEQFLQTKSVPSRR